ncbi:MAG TPA: phosphatase PAP2 family protein [Planctomycetota bacterium]|nr:phosphatase PAP2 family protein [Planctomycetota bacterium]
MKLLSFDAVVFGYLGIVTALVVAFRPPGTGLYLAAHAGGVGLILAIVWAHGRVGGRIWSVARHWYVVPVVLACFRELHYLVPEVHPFDDLRWDARLAAIDRRWFGDVDGFFLSTLTPATADLLHLCYWFYFASMVIPGAVLHRQGRMAELRTYTCVILTCLFLSYLGYFAVPAVGPHHFFPARPEILDGWLVGGAMHQAIVTLEKRMADAFPSGHTLMSLVVMTLAWRYDRRIFWSVVAPSTGCILATMALRYHYVVDVLASFALWPAALGLGFAIDRAWGASRGRGTHEGSAPVPPSPIG